MDVNVFGKKLETAYMKIGEFSEAEILAPIMSSVHLGRRYIVVHSTSGEGLWASHQICRICSTLRVEVRLKLKMIIVVSRL